MIISGIGNWKVMGSIKICNTKKWFFIVLVVCLLIVIYPLRITFGKFWELCARKHNTAFCFVVLPVVSILLFIFLCYSCVWWLPKSIFRRRKLIMNKNISKADDLFPNIASMIPSVDEVDFLEGKVLRYFKDIKKALISSFNCEICFMASGSVPERFGVPLVDDWITNNGSIRDIHALLSDLDFLIKPSGITASYSAGTIEIVRSESFIVDGFAKLRVSTCTSRKVNLKEGFLSTDTIKKLVL